MMSEIVQVTAEVLDYIPNAMEDSYDDGSFDLYDATELRIVTPMRWAGRRLTIYHDNEISNDSLWRRSGRKILFDITLQNIFSDDLLFSDAVDNLRAP